MLYLVLYLIVITMSIVSALIEQFTWNSHDDRPIYQTCDDKKEYHMYRAFKFLLWCSIAYITYLLGKKDTSLFDILLIPFLYYGVYYLIYSLAYNRMRLQKWYHNRVYHIWKLEIPYPSRSYAVAWFFASTALIVWRAL